MKRIIIRVPLFIIALIAIDYSFGILLSRIHNIQFENDPENLSYKTDYMIKKVDADIVIVGSSIASHHYIPSIMEDSLGLRVYNCAIDGHFFLYQNQEILLMLKRYQPKVIIWEIGETSLSTSKDLEYQSINDLYQYYSDSSTKTLIDRKDKFQKYKMLSRIYRWNSSLSTMVYAAVPHRSFVKGYVPIEDEGKNYPEHPASSEQTYACPDKIKVLTETIQKCHNKGVLLIITSSPRFVDRSIYNNESYTTLVALLDSTNTPYINNYSIFDSKNYYFKDYNHMNDTGAKEYMKVFIPQLKKVIANHNSENGIMR